MVYRVYVEKKEALANEARALLEDLRAFLGIQSLTGLRLFNRYDLEGKGELVVYPEQAFVVTQILEAIYESAHTGKLVEL